MAKTITYYSVVDLYKDGALSSEDVTCLKETYYTGTIKGKMELVSGRLIEKHLREEGRKVSLPEWYDKMIDIDLERW